MKKIILILTLLLPIIFYSCSSLTKDNSKKTNPNEILTLNISKNETLSNTKDVFIDVIFKNVSDSTIKLLDIFEPFEGFFLIEIKKQDGTDIIPLGAAFIDFSRDARTKFKYITLGKNGSYKKQINLTEVLKRSKNFVLEPGTYKIIISYHNQYGDNCVKGRFNSNEIEFSIDK